MIILIDNYDSFTFNIFHYLGELGAKIKVYRNDEITPKQIFDMKPQGIVLSPGPKTPNEAGICLDIIKENKNFPILGICLGHQSIGQAFGGSIIQCKEIMHGKIDLINHSGHKIFRGVNTNFEATRYHSLIIKRKTLPSSLKIIAETKNKIIMGIAHKNKKIFGLQFHPESIGTRNGKIILKNFLNLINYEY
jgi:anthranilate synthase component II